MIIACKGVSKRFGSVAAVDNATFSVEKGEVVGFVGANGAGKTTAISMLMGFIAPTSGTVEVFGKRVLPHAAHRTHQNIGYATGDMQLPGNLTARQYFAFFASMQPGVADRRLKQLSQRFQPVLDKKIRTLSRGNKQKIALIAAFLHAPKLVILDEPTSGLDPVMQERFLELVREEADRGTTIFMSSHYLTEVADVCSRVILMRRGKIVSDTPAHEILTTGGKKVRIVSGYARTVAPRGAESVEKQKTDEGLEMSFEWRKDPSILQQWLAGVKQLRDIEITESNLESVVQGMYDEEVQS